MSCFSNNRTLHLRLELDLSSASDPERGILHTLGEATEGISRDIIVPTDMTLHALHFAIQKLFGWRNTHLHHFSFPADVHAKLTKGLFGEWSKLCGVFFSFPEDDYQSLCWDDDLGDDEPVDDWLRRRYSRPYYHGFREDLYIECQSELRYFCEQHPIVQVPPTLDDYRQNENCPRVVKTTTPQEATIDEMRRTFDFGVGLEALLERLSVYDLFLSTENPVGEQDYDGLSIELPLTKELDYFYDYGDGWHVRISVANENVALSALEDIEVLHQPICIGYDGLSVMDDADGLTGYCDFLVAMFEEKSKHKKRAIERAKMMGWTGKMPAPENLL